MMGQPWEETDYRDIRELYDRRVEAHRILSERLKDGDELLCHEISTTLIEARGLNGDWR
jgi:hypothetical protein